MQGKRAKKSILSFEFAQSFWVHHLHAFTWFLTGSSPKQRHKNKTVHINIISLLLLSFFNFPMKFPSHLWAYLLPPYIPQRKRLQSGFYGARKGEKSIIMSLCGSIINTNWAALVLTFYFSFQHSFERSLIRVCLRMRGIHVMKYVWWLKGKERSVEIYKSRGHRLSIGLCHWN